MTKRAIRSMAGAIALAITTIGFPLVSGATSTLPIVTNLPTHAVYGGSFTATIANATSSAHAYVTVAPPTVCSASGLVVSFTGVGPCSVTAWGPQKGTTQTFTIGRAQPVTPTIVNPPTSKPYPVPFALNVATSGDGARSLVSSTPTICTTSVNPQTRAPMVDPKAGGTCTVTPSVAATKDFTGATGSPVNITISPGRLLPTQIGISNAPASGVRGTSFTAEVSAPSGAGTPSLQEQGPTCSVAGLKVTFLAQGRCVLIPHVAASADFLAASGEPVTIYVSS